MSHQIGSDRFALMRVATALKWTDTYYREFCMCIRIFMEVIRSLYIVFCGLYCKNLVDGLDEWSFAMMQ